MDLNQPDLALAEYEVALRNSPNRLNGLLNGGRAAEATGGKARAAAHYSALLKTMDSAVNPFA